MAKRPPSSGTSGRSSGGITGTTSRIIHSGLLLDLRNESTTLSRLANLSFLAAEVSVRIFSRSSTASVSTCTRLSSSLIASAPICALKRVKPYSSRALRNWSSFSSWFCLSSVSPGSTTT